MKDIYTIPDDVIRTREQALKLTKHGSLQGREAVRVDPRTVVFKKVTHK